MLDFYLVNNYVKTLLLPESYEFSSVKLPLTKEDIWNVLKTICFSPAFKVNKTTASFLNSVKISIHFYIDGRTYLNDI